jgi:hypothetical protein
MARAVFVLLSALTALGVGTWEFVVLDLHREWKGNETWGATESTWYVLLVLPSSAAAAISAYVSTRDPRFHERTQWARTFRVCFLAYLLYVPLFTAGMLLSWFSTQTTGAAEWGELIRGLIFFIPAIAAIVFALSIVPVLVLEYIVVASLKRRVFAGARDE